MTEPGRGLSDDLAQNRADWINKTHGNDVQVTGRVYSPLHVEWWAQEKWPTSDEWDYARPFTTYDAGATWVVAMREKFPDGKFRLVERRVTEEITHA